MNDHSGTSNIITVVKSTIRGKIAVACSIIAIISLVSKDVPRTILWLLIAGILMVSASKSVKKKRTADENAKTAAERYAIKSNATKCIGDYLYVNENAKVWCAPTVSNKQYEFSDLLDFAVIENGDTVVGGSILGTAVGAMAGGFTGALLGATASKVSDVCVDLKIKISVNDMRNPVIYISLIDQEIRKEWPQYKEAVETAENIAGVLSVIKARNEN